MKKWTHLNKGFTLAEIIVSIFLLSILAVSIFKSSYLVSESTNTILARFMQIHTGKLNDEIQKLKTRYSIISVDEEFSYLNCLVSQKENCG